MTYPFRPDPIIRIRVPELRPVERRRYPQMPYPPATVEAVRQLVEGTTLTFAIIGQRIGVHGGTISRWAEKYDWVRPEGAVPGRRRPELRWARPLVGRLLAGRLRIQVERLVRHLEAAPQVDPKLLAEALALLAQARQEQRVRTPRPQPPPARPEQPGGRRRSQHDRAAAALKGWRKRYSRLETRHGAMWER